MASRTDVLEKGARCNNTLAVQGALNLAHACEPSLKLGVPLVLDGIFGSKTDAAVRQFQTKRRLEFIDGIVGGETGGQLFEFGHFYTDFIIQVPKGALETAQSGSRMAITAPKAPPIPNPPSVPPVPNLQLTDPTKAADTASLLVRDRAFRLFENVPRTENLKLAMPKLALFKSGIDPALLSMSGVARQIIKFVPGGLQIYNAIVGEKQSLFVQMETKDFSTYIFRYATTAPIAQPTPLPYYRSESKTEVGQGGVSFTHLTAWQSSTPTISFADRLKLSGTASLYAGMFAAWRMGAPTAGGEFGAKVQADAALTILKKPVEGPFGTALQSLDLSVSGGYGVTGTVWLDHNGLSADTVHGPFLGLSLSGVFTHDPKH